MMTFKNESDCENSEGFDSSSEARGSGRFKKDLMRDGEGLIVMAVAKTVLATVKASVSLAMVFGTMEQRFSRTGFGIFSRFCLKSHSSNCWL
jgi:hypothetical protein